MKITADTNILVRAVMADHPEQSRAAQLALAEAELVALTIPTLCELVWVLSRGYGIAARDIAETIKRLTNGDSVTVDRPALAAGLAMLDAGGDFADGVIAHEGRRLGADVFVSFDRTAVKLLGRQGASAHLCRT